MLTARSALASAPVPVSDTLCGLPLASPPNWSIAVRRPSADGVNATDTVHEAPGAMIPVVVQCSEVMVKSPAAPLIDAELTNNDASPVFDRVTTRAELVV